MPDNKLTLSGSPTSPLVVEEARQRLFIAGVRPVEEVRLSISMAGVRPESKIKEVRTFLKYRESERVLTQRVRTVSKIQGVGTV